MLISETFYSLQGEGELTGVPSCLMRTWGWDRRWGGWGPPYAAW